MRIRGLAPRPAERAVRTAARGAGALAVMLLVACATGPRSLTLPPAAPRLSTPASPPSSTLGGRLAAIAESQIGVPYRYGGAGSEGFDCSGLVFYAHTAVGLRVPRTVAAQSAAARPVAPDRLALGDLVFFRLHGTVTDHVGIYAGDGRFVHAPAHGRAVRLASLADPYYAARYAGAGRFWTAAGSGGGESGLRP